MLFRSVSQSRYIMLWLSRISLLVISGMYPNFFASDYGLEFGKFESVVLYNSPNLSIFPLLAYHKICNDHYRNEKWQPFEPWTCNIDYLGPPDNMNANQFIDRSTFNSLMTSILDLENSNLPMDYFTSVLPRAQYGDESAASVSKTTAEAKGQEHTNEIGRAHV